MKGKSFKDYLTDLKQGEKSYTLEKDNQTLVYIYQLTDLFFNEMTSFVLDKKALHNSTYNILRKSILDINSNLISYLNKVKTDKEKDIDELLKISFSNDFIDMKNLTNVYNNFKKEIEDLFNVEDKINTLVDSNIEIFKADLYSKTVILKQDTTSKVIENYKKLYKKEFINNLSFKKCNVLRIYKNFINNTAKDFYDKKDKIKKDNLRFIANVSYDYLKKIEFNTIDKYTKENKKLITSFFNEFEKEVTGKKIAVRKKIVKDKTIDYFIDFNITMNNMIKNVFLEMNDILTLDNDKINNKLKDFNNLITRVFTINLVFDKQFTSYENSFIIKNHDKFDHIYEERIDEFLTKFKTNIFSIFRENVIIYNDIIYKTINLKSKYMNSDELLNIKKVKDLLLK